jgi:hypothetical protein
VTVANTVNVECAVVANVNTQAPCPAGQRLVAVQRNYPEVEILANWGEVSALSAAMVIAIFASGLGAGYVVRMLKGV